MGVVVDSAAWRYAFYAYLIYLGAPATKTHLADLTEAMEVMKGHTNPIEAAEEVIRSWPFGLTD